MNEEAKAPCTCVLRLFGAPEAAVRQTLQVLPHVQAQCASRGAELLVALQTEQPQVLVKAEKVMQAKFSAALYGKGEQNLAAATVAALEHSGHLLACADAEACALLEPRLESLETAARVFDFGSMSCADAQTRTKVEQYVARKRPKTQEIKELARVQATVRIVGAELAAGCVAQLNGSTLLLVGTHRGCYLRTVDASENAALWLLDMVRRAANGLKQADGTCWQKYTAKLHLPAAVAEPSFNAAVAAAPSCKKGHIARNVLVCLLLLALLGFASAWYTTGGDLSSLPEVLGFSHQLHSGAQFM